MAFIEKRGDVWRVQIRRKGFAHFSKSFKTEHEAQLWSDSIENSFKQGNDVIGEKVLMKNIFDRYEMEELPKKSKMQQRDEVTHLNFWKKNFYDKFFNEVNPLNIEICADTLYQIVSKQTGKNISSETRRKYLMTFSYIFNTACHKWKWINFNPVYAVDKHMDRCRKQKEIRKNTVKINMIDEQKTSYLEGIRRKMEQLGLSSAAQCATYTKMPKSSIISLLCPTQSCSFTLMVKFAKALGLDFKFTWIG